MLMEAFALDHGGANGSLSGIGRLKQRIVEVRCGRLSKDLGWWCWNVGQNTRFPALIPTRHPRSGDTYDLMHRNVVHDPAINSLGYEDPSRMPAFRVFNKSLSGLFLAVRLPNGR